MQHDTLSLSQTRHSYGIANGYSAQTSLITSVLPSIIRKRISPLRSLRDIASTYIRPSLHQRRTSDSSNASAPPPYSEEPGTSDNEMDYTSASSSRPSSSGSTTPIPRALTDLLRPGSQSDGTLVRNKFAYHGLLLVAQSAHESTAGMHTNDEYQRRIYLDGIAYLLRGLPNGLSEEEIARLRAALPETVKEPSALDWPRLHAIQEPTQDRQHTLLRTVVQTVVFWFVFLFIAALPHVRKAANRVYAFEQKHRLGEYILAQILLMAQAGFAQVLALVCAIWTMNDGAVGRSLTDFGTRWAQSVREGIRDGFSEAAAALRRSDEQR